MIFTKSLLLAWVSSLSTACSFSIGTAARGLTMATAESSKPSKPRLFDMPVSNNGARCRFIIYEKGLESQVDIVTPMELGGLKSPEFLAINPHGKMPTLVTEDGMNIPESDTIARYMLDRFSAQGTSFKLPSLEGRTKAEAICRLHDMYITTIQTCLYRATPPYGIHTSRRAAIEDLKKQLANLEDLASAKGPFLAGPEVSLADAACMPTFVFITFIMPKFGYPEQSSYMGPRLQAWWDHICKHPAGSRVFGEIEAGLRKWEENKRWDTIMLAGKRDTAPATIFDKILEKEIPSTVVFEDDQVLAFRDINPQAPTHVLIIPKRRDGLTKLTNATKDHAGQLGHMLTVAADVANSEGLDGCRLVINDGDSGGQEVMHLHMHLLGGRKMGWPPG